MRQHLLAAGASRRMAFGKSVRFLIAGVILLLANTEVPAARADTGQVLPAFAAEVPRSWLYEGAIYAVQPYLFDGTLRGITAKVPELAALGVKTVYLLPIFVSVADRPDLPAEKRYHSMYTIKDYYRIDRAYGTPEDLKDLVATAHRHHLRVLLDLVLNHTQVGCEFYERGWIHQMPLEELQRKAAALGWPLEYSKKADPRGGWRSIVASESKAGGGQRRRYHVQAIVDGGLAKLNHAGRPDWGVAVDYAHADLIRYVTEMTVHYVRDFDIDGWRLDAPGNNWNPALIEGDHSILPLLRTVKAAMARIKPDVVLVSESERLVPGGPTAMDEVCEACYDHDYFFQTLSAIPGLGAQVAAERSLPLRLESGGVDLLKSLAKEEILHHRMRLRALCIPGMAVRARIAMIAPEALTPLATFSFMIPGVPFIVAGDEVAATKGFGVVDPRVDDRGHPTWQFLQTLLRLRNGSNALKFGSLENVLKAPGNMQCYAFLRAYGEEKVLVAVNFENRAAEMTLAVPLQPAARLRDALSGEAFSFEQPQQWQLSLPPHSARVFVPEKRTNAGQPAAGALRKESLPQDVLGTSARADPGRRVAAETMPP